MRKVFGWLGVAGLAVGLLLIVANISMHFMGISASYNIGDPSKFEFRLISFWQIGATLACIGLLLGLISRRL